MGMHVASLHRHPVKSLGRETLDEAMLDRPGIVHDRAWVLIDEDGTILTQREVPQMALVPVRAETAGLVFPDLDIPPVAIPDGQADLDGRLWNQPHGLRLAPQTASDALSARLGRTVRLAFQHDPEARRVQTDEFDSPVSLADDLPVLLTTNASLDALNATLKSPVPMARFRPNIVVDGAVPWAEDHWVRLRMGDAVLRVVQKCTRCLIVTIDPETARRPSKVEPLRTLTHLRKHTGAPTFGVQAIVERPGMITSGSPCEILDATD